MIQTEGGDSESEPSESAEHYYRCFDFGSPPAAGDATYESSRSGGGGGGGGDDDANLCDCHCGRRYRAAL